MDALVADAAAKTWNTFAQVSAPYSSPLTVTRLSAMRVSPFQLIYTDETHGRPYHPGGGLTGGLSSGRGGPYERRGGEAGRGWAPAAGGAVGGGGGGGTPGRGSALRRGMHRERKRLIRSFDLWTVCVASERMHSGTQRGVGCYGTFPVDA